MVHVRNQNANIEPVFFSYPAVREMDLIIEGVVAGNEPVYDFVASDGFGHKFWVIDDPEVQQRITKIFAGIPGALCGGRTPSYRRRARARAGENEAKRTHYRR